MSLGVVILISSYLGLPADVLESKSFQDKDRPLNLVFNLLLFDLASKVSLIGTGKSDYRHPFYIRAVPLIRKKIGRARPISFGGCLSV